jgi:hypothetical protein
MNKRIFISLTLMILILAGMLSPTAAMALGITTVTPAKVVNSADSPITIQGDSFAADAQVSLSTYGNIQTSFVDANTLTAIVPQGLPAGIYTMTVLSGGSSVSLNNSLEIVNPTPVPVPPTVTATTEPTAVPQPFGRPQMALNAYRVNTDMIRYGKDFNVVVRLENAGKKTAYNVQVVFSSSNLTPLKNGGMDIIPTLGSGSHADATQQMRLTEPLYNQSFINMDVTVTYYDEAGTSYTDKFTLTLPLQSSGGFAAAATPTPTSVKSSQLVITQYQTNVQPLQPGMEFSLDVTVQNMGNATAQRVTMIVGGGSTGSGGETPQPGGVSGGSGQFSQFAPLGASNVQSLGDLAAAGTLKATQNLIVNVTTEPGAYPVPITFSYLDGQGNVVNDEQVITLLVYNLPKLDINFYSQVGPMTVGMPNPLPLQVVNLGKKAAVLGNMRIESPGGSVENGTMLVGALESGGYTTLDAMLFPNAPGSVDLVVTIDYTDDFGQTRQVSKTLTVEVLDMPIEPTLDPNMPTDGGMIDGGGGIPTEETFLQKAWRFILGLFGLDSSTPQPVEVMPGSEGPIDGGGMPAPSGGGVSGPKG